MSAGQRRRPRPSWSMADFSVGETIGEGRYGRVIHAVVKTTTFTQSFDDTNVLRQSPSSRPTIKDHPSRHVAIKIMDKSLLIRSKQTKAALRERKILSSLTDIFYGDGSSSYRGDSIVPRLLMSFVDANSLYIVTELCDGGSLTDLVRYIQNEDTAADRSSTQQKPSRDKWGPYLRFISAQVVCGMEFLHFRGYIHCDLKPDNVVLLSNGYVRIVDFGLAIKLEKSASSPTTAAAQTPSVPGEEDDFVGTSDFVAPEVLRGDASALPQSQALDLWSYGCIIHYIFAGQSPFHAKSDYLAMVAVLAHADASRAIRVDSCIPIDAKSLVEDLLVNQPDKRLGYRDSICFEQNQNISPESPDASNVNRYYSSIRKHAYFAGIDWNSLDDGTAVPPCTPPTPIWVERFENGTTVLKDGSKIQNDIEWLS